MTKLFFFAILISGFAVPSYAGEHHDKMMARIAAQQKEQREAAQAKQRDMQAEDELYKEIEEQEHRLSQMRKKLYYLHQDNIRKYGDQNYPPEQQGEYDDRYHGPYMDHDQPNDR